MGETTTTVAANLTMCGLSGFVDIGADLSDNETELLAQKMMGVLHHRGPDSNGAWCDKNHRVTLTHNRLAIQDLSNHGAQPMHSASGRYVIVFNGEVYNYRDLRAELRALGASFRGGSDTEVLLAAISEWGLDTALTKMHGMFAFALWDRDESTLQLVRDRMGEKPLYYGIVGGLWVFGSELKAINQCPDFNNRIDSTALELYFRFNFVPDPHCIFDGLHKVAPGEVVSLSTKDPSLVKTRKYWAQTSDVADTKPTHDALAACDRTEHLLRQSIQRQMIADVPIGVFLSGGTDSSLVTALAQSNSTVPINTFTVGFQEAEFDEAIHAREIAKRLGTSHTECILSEDDALSLISTLSSVYDEPFGDSSQLPTILVSKIARQHVTVALGGDGGDELFGGYSRYEKGLPVLEASKLDPLSRHLSAKIFQLCSYMPVAQIASKFVSWAGGGRSAEFISRIMASKAELALDNEPSQQYSRRLSFWPDALNPAGIPDPDVLSRLLVGGDWKSDQLVQMMRQDVSLYLPGDLLTKVDRAAMSVSLETRLPFLDHELVEFAQGIPGDVHRSDGRGKYILRKLLANFLPDDLISRPKMGFAIPVDRWLRGELREWGEDLLNDQSAGITHMLNMRTIMRDWQLHQKGELNRGQALWGVLSLLAWARASLDRVSDLHPATASEI